MTEHQFQIFECSNNECRLRFPNDLSITVITVCPFCSSTMVPVGAPYKNFHAKPDVTRKNKTEINLLLDNLRSTENVGSIFRTANGAGASHVYCCGTTPTPEHPRVKKASLGAEIDTGWTYHRNSIDLAAGLSATGCELIALEATPHSTTLFNFFLCQDQNRDIVLIIGNEISGIDPQLLEMASHILHIPMVGVKTSLNAAVAVGIALYYLACQILNTKKSVLMN